MENSELRDQVNLTLTSVTKAKGLDPASSAIEGRERIKIEFYKTYDVMTGIRIAATLGGFFSMMILLVLYKNYCKPSKTLSEEQLNAAVTAAVEEEDRALKAALETTSFYTSLSQQRKSVAYQATILPPRFSSVGGGCSHLTPPLRLSHLQQRGKSLPGSALRFSSEERPERTSRDADNSEDEEDEDFAGDGQLPDYFVSNNYLIVPPDRRLSSITCSSTDSSYLERRGSAFEMGLPAPPCFIRNEMDNKKVEEEGPWDFYYPIDIQVIQPTPEISPAESAETLYEEPQSKCGLQVPGCHDRMQRPSAGSSEADLAPLASISSLASFNSQSSTISNATAAERSDANHRSDRNGKEDSIGSDSVFMDDDVDTGDEVEEFCTDTELDYDGFDDDYSFCESSKRPASRCQMRRLRFASFDSYDGSVAQDTLSEEGDKGSVERPVLRKQFSMDVRRASDIPEGHASKRKLSKTHSEPKSQKVMKQLPLWIERGRSGYVPKRQMSVPNSRKKSQQTASKSREASEGVLPKGEATNFRPDPFSSGNSSSDSNIISSNVTELGINATLPQGKIPLVRSLSKQEDKKRRFQKQRTVHEECAPKLGSDGAPTLDEASDKSAANSRSQKQCNFLRVPQINVDKASCERLNVLPRNELSAEGKEIALPRSSSKRCITRSFRRVLQDDWNR